MSDPIEKLNRLGDAMEGAPMPLPASEIRARGDRIRRRKHAVIAGAGAAVVAAVAVPVVAFTVTGSSDDEPAPTPSPTITDSVPAAPLSAENLLTGEDAIYPTGGSVDWDVRNTVRGDGQGAYSACTETSMSGLGADAVFQRNFDFVVTDTGEVDATNHLNEIVAEFPSADEAEAAYAEIKGWYDDCLPFPATRFDAGEFTPVPIDVDGTAEAQLAVYGPVEESIDPNGELGYFLETGMVLSGDRIAVLSQSIIGQDYNFAVTDRPVVQMLPTAAERLVLGTGTEPDQTPTEVETDWPTTIPAGFPLESGWPEDVGSSEYQLDEPSGDNQSMIDAGELQACVFSPADPGELDRLTARLSDGSDNYVRELQLFPTDQEAVTYLAQLRALYQGCPTDDQNGAPPTFTTEVGRGAIGDESVVVTRASDGIGRVVINVVRIGNAVVVDLASDEGTGDTVQDLATVTRENLADVISEMYELQGGGSAPDLSDPAATTEVPADFPLDAVVGGEQPVEDGETTIDGPAPDVEGVRPQTACGADLAMPGGSGSENQLGYAVSTIGGYDGRTIRAYPSVQDAIDQMRALRSQLQGCDRDNEGDGLSDRLWESFNSDTGYDSMTFGWTYEATESQGPTAGQLYTVVRVANAILAIEWGSEGSAQSQVDFAPDQVELAQLIAEEMCLFQEAGC